MKWHGVVLGVLCTPQVVSSPEKLRSRSQGKQRQDLYPYFGNKGVMLQLHPHLVWVEGHGTLLNIHLSCVLAPVLAVPVVRAEEVISEGTKGCVSSQVSQGIQTQELIKIYTSPPVQKTSRIMLTFTFNQEICAEATALCPRCFVSFMQETLG